MDRLQKMQLSVSNGYHAFTVTASLRSLVLHLKDRFVEEAHGFEGRIVFCSSFCGDERFLDGKMILLIEVLTLIGKSAYRSFDLSFFHQFLLVMYPECSKGRSSDLLS